MDESHGATVNHAQPQTPSPSAPASIAIRLWSAINRRPGATLLGVAGFYLAIACAQAATKLLWTDELITLAIARQGSLAAIWRALAAGADPNPPLTHWLVLQSICALGQSALAVRLPAILCVLLALVCVWAILRRWVAPGFAAAGCLAFMATRGFDYAYDARSYAPLMGFTMASLACWLTACDHQESPRDWPPQNLPRLTALAGMAAALALGLSSNYYGVLAFLPIAAGEIVRTARMRRIEPGTWLAMVAAALPLLAFRPLIRHNLAEFGPHAWNRPQPGMIVSSYLELVEGVFWPVLGFAFYAVWKYRRARSIEPAAPSAAPRAPSTPPGGPQPHESSALLVLLLYPILGYLIALAGHGMISPRCVVPVCCGFGMAAALLGARLFAASPRAGLILLCSALVWVAARESACAFVLAQQRTAFFALRNAVAARPATQPILVADSLFVLPLAHYSSEPVRARIVFPIDFAAIHALEADDSGEQNLWAGRDGLFPFPIVPYDSTLLASPSFTVIARPNGWLAQSLTRNGFQLSGDAHDAHEQPWDQLGGIFTPMAHPETRILDARRP